MIRVGDNTKARTMVDHLRARPAARNGRKANYTMYTNYPASGENPSLRRAIAKAEPMVNTFDPMPIACVRHSRDAVAYHIKGGANVPYRAEARHEAGRFYVSCTCRCERYVCYHAAAALLMLPAYREQHAARATAGSEVENGFILREMSGFEQHAARATAGSESVLSRGARAMAELYGEEVAA